MLEQFFAKPATLDRLGGSWIGAEIEAYVGWMVSHDYSTKCIWRRVPIAYAFGEFARAMGAGTVGDLPAHVEAFVAERVVLRDARTRSTRSMAKEVQGPVEQFLAAVLPGFERSGRRRHSLPFASVVPGFFDYLVEERGLRPASVLGYRHHLDRFEAYLQRISVKSVAELSPAILSAFVVERAAAGLAKSSVRDGVGVLRVFLRYAHREGAVATDLSGAVEWPQVYRLSSIPRSISWAEVNRVLAGVDRRTEAGRRNYAILLLLVTYGLRGREVAALTLDDIDWKRDRLTVPERKAGHSTAFPLEASPLRATRRQETDVRLPFLFDTDQARRVLQAAKALPDNSRAVGRGSTYHGIFALCYGLGLRAGEACGLRLDDVDVERHLLVVRGGKFGKSRLVPYGPRIGELLARQVERRGGVGDGPLFSFDGRRSLNSCTASQVFHRLMVDLAFPVPEGVSTPHLHSLRHSFAVGCLLRWYREGVDPAARLVQLSTFMGHVSPLSTAVYLTITPQLLEEANRRFETFAASLWTESTP